MQDYLSIANSSWMWFAAFIPMCVLGAQVLLLLRKSLQDGKKMGIQPDQVKRAIVGSATASIGPSLAIFAGLISLILMMGAPIAWLRLSYIGAVMYELTSADVGAQAVGVAFTPESMNVTAFANGVWAMVLGSIGWIIVSGLFTDKIDKLRSVMSGGDSASLPIITAGATLGCYCYLTFSRLYPVVASNRQIYAVFGGAATMLFLTLFNKNRKAKWVSEWGATIAMVIGMACAAVMK